MALKMTHYPKVILNKGRIFNFVGHVRTEGDIGHGRSPPLIWTKSKRKAIFPQENVPYHSYLVIIWVITLCFLLNR